MFKIVNKMPQPGTITSEKYSIYINKNTFISNIGLFDTIIIPEIEASYTENSITREGLFKIHHDPIKNINHIDWN